MFLLHIFLCLRLCCGHSPPCPWWACLVHYLCRQSQFTVLLFHSFVTDVCVLCIVLVAFPVPYQQNVQPHLTSDAFTGHKQPRFTTILCGEFKKTASHVSALPSRLVRGFHFHQYHTMLGKDVGCCGTSSSSNQPT